MKLTTIALVGGAAAVAYFAFIRPAARKAAATKAMTTPGGGPYTVKIINGLAECVDTSTGAVVAGRFCK